MKRIIILLTIVSISVHCLSQTACDSCWLKSELYFGMSIPTGGKVCNRQWKHFLNEYINPNFPVGSTVIKAKGQWMDRESGSAVTENSRVLIIFYPQSRKTENDKKLKDVSAKYIKLFKQQAVIRTDQLVKFQFYSQ